MPEPDVVSQRIRQRRNELGLTQDALAAQMQLRGYETLQRERIVEIETGVRRVLAVEVIGFARILRVPITWLLGVPDFE